MLQVIDSLLMFDPQFSLSACRQISGIVIEVIASSEYNSVNILIQVGTRLLNTPSGPPQ